MTFKQGLIALALIGFGWACIQIGKDLKQGEWDRASLDQAKQRAEEQEQTAKELARLEAQAQIVRERVIRETVERPVYRECAHSQRVLNDINAAITGQSASPGELPASSASE